MSHLQKSKLSNGIRVVQVASHDTQAVTVLVLFEVGSRYETHALSGASHFVEHMMFKGTKRRPTTMDISRDLDSVGADYNAFTGKDYTGYYIKLDASHTDLAVDMLHDMLFRSLYRQEECERERDVIYEEINMYEDNPIMHSQELLEGLLFEGQPLGRIISGTHATMKGISRSALIRYRDSHYVPSNMVIAVAGKIDGDVMAMLEKTFGTVREPRRAAPSFRRASVRTGRPKVALKYKETEQVLFNLGFPGLPYGHKRLPALSLLATILGGGMSSRLFTEVRERRGLAYSVSADVEVFQDTGYFAIFAGLAKSKLDEGVRTIMKELGTMAASGPTAEELKRAKDYIRGKMVLRLEAPSALADFYARQELLTKRLETPEDKIKKLIAVTRDDVRSAARQVFRTSGLSASVIGPYKDAKHFIKLLSL